MNKITKALFIIILFIIFPFLYCSRVTALSGKDISEETGRTIIPFTKKWQNVEINERPAELKIKLYKYLGDTFSESTAILIEEAVVNAENNWQYDFDISEVELFDNNNAFKFKIVEEVPVGFEEVTELHEDPNVIFTPPQIADGWDRVEPCSQIDITTNGNFKTIVVAKMTGNQGNKYIVWTIEPLSETEREMVFEGASTVNGFGNAKYENFVYISGTQGEYVSNGETVLIVDEKHINFQGGTKVWSLFATGLYSKSSTDSNSSSITNTIKTINLSVKKIWNDHDNILGLRPNSIIVKLLNNNEEIKEIVLSSANDWEYVFTNLPEYTDGNKNNYTVKEVISNGYISKVVIDNNNVIITNTYEVKSTTITVTKEWKNTSQLNELPGIIIALYYKENADDELTEIARITLNKENNWTYTFTKGEGKFDILPVNYIYEIKEIGYDVSSDEQEYYKESFSTTYQQDNNNWLITNTYKYSYILPETGSSNTIILTTIATVMLGMPIIYMVYSFFKKDI